MRGWESKEGHRHLQRGDEELVVLSVSYPSYSSSESSTRWYLPPPSWASCDEKADAMKLDGFTPAQTPNKSIAKADRGEVEAWEGESGGFKIRLVWFRLV